MSIPHFLTEIDPTAVGDRLELMGQSFRSDNGPQPGGARFPPGLVSVPLSHLFVAMTNRNDIMNDLWSLYKDRHALCITEASSAFFVAADESALVSS